MAQINPVLPDVLENRYASEHVGGAFNAKNIPTPKSTEQALSDATFGRKPDESLMLEGQDTRRYVKHDDIIPEVKPQISLGPRGVQPKVAKSTRRPSRKLITKVVLPAQRISRVVATASPGTFPKERTVRPTIRTVPIPTVVPGQGQKSIARRPEPAGSGKPGTPLPRPFHPRPPQPIGPLIPSPSGPVFWNTDPDIWDLTKLVGQVYWDH